MPAPARPDAVGVITLVIAVYQEGDPGYSITLADGTVVQNPGFRLGDLRARLGGDHGILTDPIRGERHPVSLEPWAGLDPNSTRVIVGYQLTKPGHTPSTTLPNLPRRPSPEGGLPTT